MQKVWGVQVNLHNSFCLATVYIIVVSFTQNRAVCVSCALPHEAEPTRLSSCLQLWLIFSDFPCLQLLVKDVQKRMSLEEVMRHPWIVANADMQGAPS
jgi:hypothetical protein